MVIHSRTLSQTLHLENVYHGSSTVASVDNSRPTTVGSSSHWTSGFEYMQHDGHVGVRQLKLVMDLTAVRRYVAYFDIVGLSRQPTPSYIQTS